VVRHGRPARPGVARLILPGLTPRPRRSRDSGTLTFGKRPRAETDGVSAAPVYQGGLFAPLPIDGAFMASTHSSDASSRDRSDQDAERGYRSSPHMIRTEATFSAVDR
jgi:hypothetical protein